MSNKENAKKDFQELKDGFKQMFKDIKNPKTFYKQIPNLLTISRLGIALFIPFLAMSSNLMGASILTVVAALTDALDGFTARKLNAQSEFGRNLDPICDKLFAGILVAPLLFNSSPLLTLGLGGSLILEAGIAGINLNSKIKGNEPKTTLIGKAKTALLSLLLAVLYVSFSYPSFSTIVPLLYASTTASQLLACVTYFEIDKRKDLEKKTPIINNREPLTEEFIEDKKETLNYTIEDLKKLKKEIQEINTNDYEEEKSFQKKLK